MGTVKVLWIVILGCISVVSTEAQNATSPMDILNSMKMSVEAAGAGGLRLGPMGILGDMNGQFGVKVNKEQTSSAAKVSIAKKSRNGVLVTRLAPKNLIESKGSSLSKTNILKSCYGRRRYGGPIIIPIIVTTTAAPVTTTTAAPN